MLTSPPLSQYIRIISIVLNVLNRGGGGIEDGERTKNIDFSWYFHQMKTDGGNIIQ